MMKLRHIVVACVALAVGAPLVAAADLTKIPRTIHKEPTYKGKPKYCLLVFGPEAKTRIWLVLDGDDLYIDRDGNGDLTGPGKKAEKLDIPKPNRLQQTTSFLRQVPVPQGKITIEVTQTAYDKIRNNHIVSVGLDDQAFQKPGGYQRAGCSQYPTVFAHDPEDAAILHFWGPRQMDFAYFETPGQQGSSSALPRGPKESELYIRLGTPGLRMGSFVAHAHAGIPPKLQPVVDFEFPPREPGAKPIHRRVTLVNRCWVELFHGPVRVPDEAGIGTAKMTLSFTAWEEGHVVPATFEVRIVEPKPSVQAKKQQSIPKTVGKK